MKRALRIVALLALASAAYGWLDPERSFANPDSIFWRIDAPLLAALLAAGFALLPATGRLALASSLLCIAAVEGGAWLLRDAPAEAVVGPDYYQSDANLGWGPRHSALAQASKRVDGRVIYETEYAIDALGRRSTPVSSAVARQRFTLFFGGSSTFGEGVAQDQTLPFQFGEQNPNTVPYNYGFHGYGPQHMLAKLEEGSLRAEVPEAEGTLAYLFIDDHVKRAIGSMRVYTAWADRAPYYRLEDDGSVSRQGNFNRGRPLTSMLFSVLGRSHALEALKVDWPLRLGPQDFEVTAAILARARDTFQREFGEQRFVVVLFPGVRLGPEMRPALARRGVEVLDYSALLDYAASEHHLPDDWHPTALTHRKIAQRLAADLARDFALTGPPLQAQRGAP